MRTGTVVAVTAILLMICVSPNDLSGKSAPRRSGKAPALPLNNKQGQAKPSAEQKIPDTPAGRTLKAWVNAFNSGDQQQIEAYCSKYEPNRKADEMMSFRDQTGGFELLQILKSEPLRIEFLVKERNSDTRGRPRPRLARRCRPGAASPEEERKQS